ncbi:ankyrin repeat-containing domain protein [Flagelloscypha sp. PMI_526]|nr:ankyrin repeat-containing domain protein [Flagelloscypha sp. PMI_526]
MVALLFSWHAVTDSTDVVHALLSKTSIDPNLGAAKLARTPLLVACTFGHLDITRLLLARDDPYPASLRRWSRRGGEIPYSLLETADFGRRNSNGYSLLHLACFYGHLDLVSFLLLQDNIDDFNILTPDGNTPLHLACGKGHSAVANLLLSEPSVDTNCVNQNSWSPLHYACLSGCKEIVQRLLDKGSDPNQLTNDSWSPLTIAAYQNLPEIVELVLARTNIDCNIYCNFPGPTPQISSSSTAHSSKFTLFHWACAWGYLSIAEELLTKRFANISTLDYRGMTALHWACGLRERGSRLSPAFTRA